MSANSIATAPPGRKKLARGKERSDAAPGHASQNRSSPEGAKEDGTKQAGVGRTIGDLVEPRREKAIPSEHPDLPYIGLEHIESHSTRLLGSVPATQMRSTAKRFYSGDVLYSRLRPYLNKVWHADRDGLCSSEFIVMPGNEEIDSNFLRYRLNSSDFVRFANSLNAGDRPRVDFDQISSFCLPNFSLDAQRATVAEIEKQFTRLEAGVAALRRVQANLKRYRAAVLKAACEGKLVPTEAELQKSAGKGLKEFETGEALLRRILAERRQNWTGRGKYKEPAAPGTANLSPLPAGWTWASVGQLLREPLCNGVSVKGNDNPPGVRALRLSAMSDSGFHYSDARYLPLSDADVEDLWIQEGDFFMSRGNGSLHLVGRGTSAQKPPHPTIFPDTMIRLRLADAVRTSGWVRTLWPSRIIRSQIESKVKTTAGIYKIAQPQVEGMTIPLPPLAEQIRIVAEVERRLSVVEDLESVVAANLQRATRLRQSILHQAFCEPFISQAA